MRIYIWWDHYTLEIVQKIKEYLEGRSIEYGYFGSSSEDEKIELYEFIKPVCERVVWDNQLGILVCWTGTGVNIGANKYPWIRASLCRKDIDAQWAREKDNINILCLSSWDTPDSTLYNILKNFIETEFTNEKIMKSMEIMEKWK